MKFKPFDYTIWDWNFWMNKKNHECLIEIRVLSGEIVENLTDFRLSDLMPMNFKEDEIFLAGNLKGQNGIFFWDMNGKHLPWSNNFDLVMEAEPAILKDITK